MVTDRAETPGCERSPTNHSLTATEAFSTRRDAGRNRLMEGRSPAQLRVLLAAIEPGSTLPVMMGGHISDREMEAYVFGRGSEVEARAIEAHVLECDECALKALAFDMAADDIERRYGRTDRART